MWIWCFKCIDEKKKTLHNSDRYKAVSSKNLQRVLCSLVTRCPLHEIPGDQPLQILNTFPGFEGCPKLVQTQNNVLLINKKTLLYSGTKSAIHFEHFGHDIFVRATGFWGRWLNGKRKKKWKFESCQSVKCLKSCQRFTTQGDKVNLHRNSSDFLVFKWRL